jgi:hypothetical protein
MSADNELFKLCKEVYKRTGWDGDKQFAYDDTYGDKWLRYIAEFPHESREWRLENMIPLYTSDYLLEKLQGVYGWSDFSLTSDPTESGVVWQSLYHTYDGMDYKYKSDTPLKALLKLTIALSEAGELK